MQLGGRRGAAAEARSAVGGVPRGGADEPGALARTLPPGPCRPCLKPSLQGIHPAKKPTCTLHPALPLPHAPSSLHTPFLRPQGLARGALMRGGWGRCKRGARPTAR